MIVNNVHMYRLNYLIKNNDTLEELLMKVIVNFKDKGYIFSHTAEMDIITNAKKMDLSYDFYIKHNKCALERKLNAVIIKTKSLIITFDRNWKHSLNRNFKVIVSDHKVKNM